MAKYLIDSTDIEIEEVSGTENLKFNLANGNSVEQMIGDLENLNTTNKTNLVNAINEVNQGLSYIVATINNTQTTSTDYYVTLNTIHSNQGNFTLSNGAIVIGEGIHHIRISASIFCDQWPTGDKYLWTKIYKNSTFVLGSINSSTTGVISSSASPIIIEVQQNDKIKLMADTYNTTATIRPDAANTFLCVEKID